MKFKKSILIKGLVVVLVLITAWFIYYAITFRQRPPNKGTQRNALAMLQSQDDEQILQGVHLLLVFRPAEDLRDEAEKLLSHENPDIRVISITLVARYRDVRAGILLTGMLDDPDPDVVESAQRGLHNVNNSLNLPSDQRHYTP